MIGVTRRGFLKAGAAGVSACALGCSAHQESGASQETGAAVESPATGGDFAGFDMCMATYGFRHFTGPEAVAMTKAMGITKMDLWPSLAACLGGGKQDQEGIPPYDKNPEKWGEMQQALTQHGVRAVVYGVCRFDGDAAKSRALFEWVSAQGIQTIGCAPAPEAFAHLEQLVEEFKINIAIHNHGPQDRRYGKINRVVEAVANRHPRIGACVDVGHFWRAGEDPAAAIETLGSRVRGIHLKDQLSETEGAVVGEGKMDIPGILKALKKINYAGPVGLEYEDNPEDPVPYMQRSLDNLKAMCRQLG